MWASLGVYEGNAEEGNNEEGTWPHFHLLGSWPLPFAHDSVGGILTVSRHTGLTSNGLVRSYPNKVVMAVGHRDATATYPSAFCPLFLTLKLSVLREILPALTNETP